MQARRAQSEFIPLEEGAYLQVLRLPSTDPAVAAGTVAITLSFHAREVWTATLDAAEMAKLVEGIEIISAYCSLRRGRGADYPRSLTLPTDDPGVVLMVRYTNRGDPYSEGMSIGFYEPCDGYEVSIASVDALDSDMRDVLRALKAAHAWLMPAPSPAPASPSP